MQAVILAAGRGSRLRPITDTRSKPMLPILGKPIVQRVMENLVSSGLRDFILVVNPGDSKIREHFQHNLTMDVNVHFVNQPERLGMADALMHAAPLIREDFVLSACDYLVTKEDVRSLINRWGERPDLGGLLSLIRISRQDSLKTAIVTLEGDRVTSIIEKPHPDQALSNISSLPLYCLSKGILEILPQLQKTARGEYELQDALQMMVMEGNIVSGIYFQSYLTLTTAEDLLESTIQNLLADTSLTRKTIKYSFASLTIGSGAVALVMTHETYSKGSQKFLGGAYRANTRHNDLCQGGQCDAPHSGQNSTLMATDSEELMKQGIDTAKSTWYDFLAELGWQPEKIDVFFCHQVGSAHRERNAKVRDLER